MNLTNDDKVWITQLLDHKLFGQETRIDGKLQSLDTRIDGKLQSLETRIDGKLSSLETRIDEKLFSLETKLLTAFHDWAAPNDALQRTHTATLRSIHLKMEALDDRVTKLEKKNGD